MNIATEHITNDVAKEDGTPDRRNRMKLIAASPKGRSPLRIDLDDNLRRPGTMFQGREQMDWKNRDLPGNEEFLVPGSVVLLVGIAGLAIGFLLGRSRGG